jgi:hypothetical protein
MLIGQPLGLAQVVAFKKVSHPFTLSKLSCLWEGFSGFFFGAFENKIILIFLKL